MVGIQRLEPVYQFGDDAGDRGICTGGHIRIVINRVSLRRRDIVDKLAGACPQIERNAVFGDILRKPVGAQYLPQLNAAAHFLFPETGAVDLFINGQVEFIHDAGFTPPWRLPVIFRGAHYTLRDLKTTGG